MLCYFLCQHNGFTSYQKSQCFFTGPGVGRLGTGASYGGLGGRSGASAAVYGNVIMPMNFGSGGGASGGGLLKIHVDTVLSVEGTLLHPFSAYPLLFYIS